MKKNIIFKFCLHFRWPLSYILLWPFTLSLYDKETYINTYGDYQILTNLMSYFTLENNYFKTIFDFITNDRETLQNHIKSYNLFCVGISNYLIRSIKTKDYKGAVSMYEFFITIKPSFSIYHKDTSTRILIEILYNYALFYLSGNQKKIIKAIDMYTMAIDIDDTIILAGSEDILNSILQNKIVNKDLSGLIRGSNTDIIVNTEGDNNDY